MKLAGTALLGAAFLLSAAALPGPGAAVREGDVAPASPSSPPMMVRDLSERYVDLRAELLPPSASGGGATLLVFWASWCHPCIREIPVLNELHRFYGKQGLRVVGLGVREGEETLEAVKAAASTHGAAYRVLYDKEGVGQEAFHVSAVPTAVLIDGKGVVRWIGPSLPADINGRIEEALGPGEERGPK